MRNSDILIIRGPDVLSLSAGRELELVQVVRRAYEVHGSGASSLPHSTFLYFPDNQKNRIIALPAYLGDGFNLAGIKWISSFPDNLSQEADRASAVIVLNSPFTGRPETVLEGSIISAKRTAASAALAAQLLHPAGRELNLGLIGCGVINFEIARFLMALRPEINLMVVFDIDPARASRFREKFNQAFDHLKIEAASSMAEVFRNSSLISLATTSAKPHIFDLSDCFPGSTILHVSLRDLSPEIILSCDNVVDDIDHVRRAQTSVHLAEQVAGNRAFIRCCLSDVLKGLASPRKDDDSITIFSPFGLGVLDVAVGGFLRDLALRFDQGTVIPSFLSASPLNDG